MHTIKRDGTLVPFDATKIEKAIYTAFLKDADGVMRPGASEASTSIRDKVTAITALVVANLNRRSNDGTVHIEDIQDQVELALMRSGEHKVARDYVLYREKQAQQRLQQKQTDQPEGLQERDFSIRRANGDEIYLTRDMILKNLGSACQRWDWQGNADLVMKSLVKLLFDGISEDEFVQAKIMATRPLIETDPMYAYTAGFFLLEKIRAEAFCQNPSDVFIGGSDYDANNYPANYFQDYIRKGVAIERLDKRLLDFDLDKMAEAIVPSRDLHFQYQGLQILYDRYLIHENGIRLELPQALWMRVAMGLAVNEIDREKWAIAFYNVLSTFRFVSSTPTLFNAGTTHPQLSSCYLTTVPDDLDGIFEAVKENALLSKFSGGLGNDWTPVRAMGSWIKGTNGKSQGVVPFLKVVNDTAVAVNQCFAPDTLVHTQDGPQPISHIQKGDLVLGVSGTYRQVDARMTYAQNDPMVEIRIKHSLMPIQVTTGHPVLAIQNVVLGETSARTLKRLENGKLSPTWVDAGNLQVGDYVAQTIPGEVIPVAGFTDEEAYLYGIMLGDGHVAQKQGVNREYGVTLNATSKAHLAQFVRQYLLEHDIHFWENSAHGSVVQLRWAYGRTCLRDAVNGQFVAGEEAPVLPFDFADLYNAKGEKKVSARFLHLPESQTLAILKGLLQTDGHLARGKDILFTTASLTLAENVRYLLLRLGIPSSGRQRDRRDEVHTATRKDGSQDTLSGGLSYELRIPAYPKIAALLGCEPVQKHMALRIGRWLFSRVTSIADITPVPFVCDLKVEGDESYMTTAFLAHNGGKRKGAVCAYLETWHLDIEEFLELRKNTGDDRRRTHDMNTANWIPDLFMKRVMDNAEWTLFSPNEVPDLHELYGTRFEERYAEYESMAENGQLEQFKKVPAVELWRKMLTMLFETGHPWITFKDPCNVRSPQRHAGVVHSSNLCVAPETLVLTDKGHLPISSLVNKTVKVWNGMMFSETTVHQTGVNQPLVEVRLDNGATLSCTSYHKFYIQNEYGIPAKEVRAGDLKAGDKLIKSEYPVIDDATWPDFPYAYTHGFFCGDGTYGNGRPRLSLYDVKKQLTPFLDIKAGTGVVDASGRLNFTLPFDLPEKYTVPMHFSLKSRVQWLAGLFDADGTVTKNGNASSIQIASIYPDFLESVRLMLQTVGVYSTVSLLAEQRKVSLPDGKGDSAMYDCKPIYRLMIAHNGLLMLNKLGFMPHRLKMPLTTTQRRAEHFVQVVEVKDNGRTDDTYCFSEPIRHMGVFNGILTGQCTEITLNSNDDETAVCNLGSVNLMQHLITNPVISEHGDDLETEDWPYDQLRESMTPVNALRHINKEALFETVGTAIRMLDNVIDINFYPTRKARNANMRHRAIGLGVMGFADALQALRIPMDSEAAVTFAGVSQEVISFAAIQTSADLAVARGSYSSFQGSDWSRGILPINTVQRLEIERGMELLTAQQPSAIDPDLWDAVRVRVQHGIRNSNIMAIAPTATISNIVGVSQGIDPIYQNLYVKSNLSGEFTVVNTQMVADMEKLDLWDDVMVNDLKYFDGSLAHIDRIPSWMKRLYATAFEIDPLWLVRMTAERQKWIDQSVSLNLYMAKPSGKALDNLYKQAWLYGLKTTYYLRTMGATSAEKSTVTEGTLNAVQGGTPAPAIKACLIDDPTCEACQ